MAPQLHRAAITRLQGVKFPSQPVTLGQKMLNQITLGIDLFHHKTSK